MTASLSDRILTRAHELGFVRAGIVPAAPLPHGDALRRWLDDGLHGEMSWMERTRDVRDRPDALLPGARSVIALAASYHVADERARPGEVAMYARGYDYHKVLEHRLGMLAAFIEVETGRPVRTRGAVDRLPLLERDVAYLAGIGWYGKNCMILNREVGSWLFLAELVVDLDLEMVGSPVAEFCGSCRACIDACPTDAIVAPGRLDARRCISYLTIEHRGPIPRELRAPMGMHMFGCDICQDVCPWNRKAPLTEEFAFLGRPDVLSLTADSVLEMDTVLFRYVLAQSPLQRAQPRGLKRNAAVALGNSGDRYWVPLLTRRLVCDPEPLVRGHIAWALGHLGGGRARRALDGRRGAEPEPYVKEEIRLALDAI